MRPMSTSASLVHSFNRKCKGKFSSTTEAGNAAEAGETEPARHLKRRKTSAAGLLMEPGADDAADEDVAEKDELAAYLELHPRSSTRPRPIPFYGGKSTRQSSRMWR